jgi:Cu/Ag efflux protein CusF
LFPVSQGLEKRQALLPRFPCRRAIVSIIKDITSMNASKSRKAWIIVLGVALAATGCTDSTPAPPAPTTASTAASQPLPSGTIGANLVTATARVKGIDLPTRRVTLERADGSEVTFYADDTVRNLPQVKVGDEVTASYYESLAYEVKRPGAATPGATVAEEAARAKLGEKPAGAGARVTTIVATIAGIDKAAGTVTLQGPGGRATTLKARDPRNLERVAVGDLVEITYTEAVAVSVDKPGMR